ncbi:uncharacterized protein BO96DRAFT_437121 [Aspergillus niger CBS 101883]|uniref:Uncharacterized protein n=2 Tax=Aspergillus niger TaxID=5061 RepID=A2QPF8_ASPNC|nr:uncharacterized protein BO96DRAFT_437121 [Aspergillus niger CBS 101883]XP_059601082.1 hypothetical protein An07g09300 [Aspergillus niger]PYH53493.1 hypothetical protein BO96DRAFT_437121 [Aspergillus niger CBS 101883]CAK39695.1 hypothetical protein An07g09300 [Aspergillus niger]
MDDLGRDPRQVLLTERYVQTRTLYAGTLRNLRGYVTNLGTNSFISVYYLRPGPKQPTESRLILGNLKHAAAVQYLWARERWPIRRGNASNMAVSSKLHEHIPLRKPISACGILMVLADAPSFCYAICDALLLAGVTHDDHAN